ncbi:hypothetical protein ACIQNG_20790 [Streptomyces sp. NPDC091377]|uniref:hypothetical protein n=1 Tax=Streptomyces sp. NPDC091377 TaxID=3365995 RepID=UPI003807234C
MTRPPAVRALVVTVLSAAVLVTAGGCAYQETAPPPRYLPDPPKAQAPAATAPAAAPALTEAQAQAALITETDLGEPWTPTQGAATWRDGFLKATAKNPDCRRLLDALYADELLGAPARAATGLDDGSDEAQLRYQVSTLGPEGINRVLVWLRSLPGTCATFPAVGPRGEENTVKVTDLALPEVGDAGQGLRVTITRVPDTEGDKPAVLTLDVAAVRVGDDVFALSHGGLGEILPEATRSAVERGAQRLEKVRKEGRAQV